jgi:hypothetical protein
MIDLFRVELQTLITLVRVRGEWVEAIETGVSHARFSLTVGEHLVY